MSLTRCLKQTIHRLVVALKFGTLYIRAAVVTHIHSLHCTAALGCQHLDILHCVWLKCFEVVGAWLKLVCEVGVTAKSVAIYVSVGEYLVEGEKQMRRLIHLDCHTQKTCAVALEFIESLLQFLCLVDGVVGVGNVA